MIKPTLVLLLLSYCAAGNGQFKPVASDVRPFKPGEKLSYIVKFGPIIGGTATLTLRQTLYKDKLVYHSRAEGKTVGMAEKLYSVKDVFESYFDMQTGLPHTS
jgi:hypothetical protein